MNVSVYYRFNVKDVGFFFILLLLMPYHPILFFFSSFKLKTQFSSFTLYTCMIVLVYTIYRARIFFLPIFQTRMFISSFSYVTIHVILKSALERKKNGSFGMKKKTELKTQRDSKSQSHTSDENEYKFAAVMSTISSIVLVSIFCLNVLLASQKH